MIINPNPVGLERQVAANARFRSNSSAAVCGGDCMQLRSFLASAAAHINNIPV